MRGLDEIKKTNEDPHAFHGEEQFGTRYQGGNGTHDPLDRQHSGRLVHDAALEAILADIVGTPRPKPKAADLIGLLALLASLDADRAMPRRRARPEHLGMDGILSSLGDTPPFLKFWQNLNDERAARGEGEAMYGEAKEAFAGGPTPAGALTFIGKKWDGLRAVPVISGPKPLYHGEFRQVTDEGTVWRTVHGKLGAVCYATPEAALGGALHAKEHSLQS